MINTKHILADIEKNIAKWETEEVYRKCLSFIDLTSLNSTDTTGKITGMVQKVNEFTNNFPGYSPVAAMCVYPNFASVVKRNLENSNIKIAVVSGVFPSSQSFLSIKCEESRLAVESGADEVDIVLALSHFLEGDYTKASEEIRAIKRSVGSAHLKVILESGSLKREEDIYKASMLAIEAGADFIKTSTGKSEPAATPEAAVIMCSAIKEYFTKTGKKIGFKPAGGIVTPKDAVLYYAIVDTILGEEWLNSELFRLGASRLANNLLSIIESKTINYF